MKRTLIMMAAIICIAAIANAQTYLKITLDTKLMTSPDYSLGGGNGVPSPCTKVYAHLGLCTCNLHYNGTTFIRDCTAPDSDSYFCYHQILPYRSNVWEHVVGNWGANPQDDGVGLMTTLGNGVYSIDFIIQDYFSNPALVNTTSFIDPSNPTPVVASTVWNTSDGGAPFTIGMVFRNPDATLTGRDDLGKDLFIINLTSGTTQVIQGSDPSAPFPAISFITGINDISNNNNLYLSASPNPFNDETQIVYTLTQETKNLSITVFNSLGQKVKGLFNDGQLSGSHSLIWNGTDNNGQKLPSGIYYFTMADDGKFLASEKLVISK
jgi:hypothetical protein